MAESFEKMRAMSTTDLIKQYDRIAVQTSWGLQFYRDELAHRDAEEQNQRLLEFTKQMRNMTIAITAMTGIVLLLTIANVYLVLPK